MTNKRRRASPKARGGLERTSLWLNTGLTLVGIFAGAVIGVWSVKNADSIAERSGSYNRPQVRVDIGAYELRPGDTETLLLGYTPRADLEIQFMLPLEVRNRGSKTAHKVDVIVVFPAAVRPSSANLLPSRTVTLGDSIKAPTYSTQRLGDLEFRVYHIDEIRPGMGGNALEPLVMGKAPTSDNFTVVFEGQKRPASKAYRVGIVVTSDDAPSAEYSVIIQEVAAVSHPEFMTNVTSLLAQRATAARAESTLLARVARVLSSRTEHVLAIFGVPIPLDKSEQDYYLLRGTDILEVQYMSTWRSLF